MRSTAADVVVNIFLAEANSIWIDRPFHLYFSYLRIPCTSSPLMIFVPSQKPEMDQTKYPNIDGRCDVNGKSSICLTTVKMLEHTHTHIYYLFIVGQNSNQERYRYSAILVNGKIDRSKCDQIVHKRVSLSFPFPIMFWSIFLFALVFHLCVCVCV